MASHIRVLEKLLNDLRAWVSAAVEQNQDEQNQLSVLRIFLTFFCHETTLALAEDQDSNGKEANLVEGLGPCSTKDCRVKSFNSKIQGSPCALILFISLICVCA